MATYTGANDEEFFASIGRLALAWGHLEAGLDIFVYLVFVGLGNPPGDKEIPLSLSRKIRYLRSALNKLPIGDDERDAIFQKLDEIKQEAETRHDIIHGIVVEQVENSGTAEIVRLINQKTRLEQKHLTVTSLSVLEAAQRAQQLSSFTLTLGSLLRDPLLEYARQYVEQTQ